MKQIKTLRSKVIHRFKFDSVTAKGSKSHHLSAVGAYVPVPLTGPSALLTVNKTGRSTECLHTSW